MPKKLKVAIDFRVADTQQGLGTTLLTLAQGLSRLDPSEQEYVFVVPESITGWLMPHIGGACSVVSIAAPAPSLRGRLRARLANVALLRRLWLRSRTGPALMPVTDGTIERLGCDVVHFPSQMAYLTQVPSIYQPWDLQHCHLPEFFAPEDLILRRLYYPAFCHQARFVCVQTNWGKKDLVAQFGVAAEKIVVIPWGTAFEARSGVSEVDLLQARRELRLPQTYLVYPAATWPHKNHELILRGLALLQQRRGHAIDVVFTGKTTESRVKLEELADRLGVRRYVHFLGFVSAVQIRAVLEGASALLFPSRFEGLGQPLLEAFSVGLPVLCSSATVLPEVADGAALLFDPDSPEQMVEAIEILASSPSLRAEMIASGYRVLRRYSVDTAAERFRDLYRATAGEHHGLI